MHEIKLRAWDNEKGRYAIKQDFTDYNIYEPWIMIGSGKLIIESDAVVIFEQFTGLKDKNGTEIYEGDILIDDAGEPIEYWVVKFSDGGFVGECAGVAEPLFELTNLEVVGNIHEDSQLLEEE